MFKSTSLLRQVLYKSQMIAYHVRRSRQIHSGYILSHIRQCLRGYLHTHSQLSLKHTHTRSLACSLSLTRKGTHTDVRRCSAREKSAISVIVVSPSARLTGNFSLQLVVKPRVRVRESCLPPSRSLSLSFSLSHCTSRG